MVYENIIRFVLTLWDVVSFRPVFTELLSYFIVCVWFSFYKKLLTFRFNKKCIQTQIEFWSGDFYFGWMLDIGFGNFLSIVKGCIKLDAALYGTVWCCLALKKTMKKAYKKFSNIIQTNTFISKFRKIREKKPLFYTLFYCSQLYQFHLSKIFFLTKI